jgi:iron complex outermembrane receptor protein
MVTAISVASLSASIAQAQEHAITVGQMPLPDALNEIARQSGRTITFDPDAVPGKISARVTNARNALSAVKAAIKGTGLAVSVNPDGVITVGNDIVVIATRDEAETSFRVDGAQSSNRSGKSLKELPQGTEVITSALIRDQQALTLNDALRNAGSVVNSIGNVQGTPSFSVRGNVSSALQNGVAVGTGATSIDTVERIEVLKGPSAILSGADNLGGVVNIVDKRPSAEPILDLEVQYGSFDDKKIVIDASNALNDTKTLSARIIGVQAGSERSYGDYMGRREQVIAPSLRYKTATSDFIIGLNATDQRSAFPNFRILNPATNNTTFIDLPGRIGPRDQGFHDVTTRYYASAEQRITSWFTLSARGSYTTDSLEGRIYAPLGFFNPDSPTTLFAFAQSINNQQSIRSGDIYGRLKVTTGPLKHTVSAGFNHSSLKFSSFQQDNSINTLVSFDVLADNRNLPSPGPAEIPSYSLQTEQNGLYIQDFIDFGRLHVLAAVRRNKYKTSIEFFGTGSSGPDVPQRAAQTTPSFGAVFDLTKSVSIYGNYVKGFSPNFSLSCNGDTLPNVESVNIEGGMKADFFAKRLSATVALFQLRQNNTVIPDFMCATPDRYTSRGGTQTRGVELTLNGEITSGLGVNASYTFSDYKYQIPDEVFGTIPPALYRNKYSLYLAYDIRSGAFDGFRIAGGVFGNGRTYVDSFGQISLPPQAEFDANVGYKLGRATFNLGVKNLADRKLNSIATSPAYVAYLQPRTVTASLTYSFFK